MAGTRVSIRFSHADALHEIREQLESEDPDVVLTPDFAISFDGVPFAGLSIDSIDRGAIRFTTLNHTPQELQAYLQRVLACEVPIVNELELARNR